LLFVTAALGKLGKALNVTNDDLAAPHDY